MTINQFVLIILMLLALHLGNMGILHIVSQIRNDYREVQCSTPPIYSFCQWGRP